MTADDSLFGGAGNDVLEGGVERFLQGQAATTRFAEAMTTMRWLAVW
jgi:hypothetical protein